MDPLSYVLAGFIVGTIAVLLYGHEYEDVGFVALLFGVSLILWPLVIMVELMLWYLSALGYLRHWAVRRYHKMTFKRSDAR